MDTQFLNTLKNSTPVIQDLQTYIDADDELKKIALYIKNHNEYNSYIQPEKIKFLYSPKPKKEGVRFVLFELFRRTDVDKMINDEYDFILTVFYDVWSKLEPEQKIIQLDKALCGIDMGDEKPKKKSVDSREFSNNMYLYGAEKVMRISEIVSMTCETALEERKEKEKMKKKGLTDNDIDKVIEDAEIEDEN